MNYAINLCTEKLVFATDYCRDKSGRDVDKFKEQKLTALDGEKISCPVIAQSPVNLQCKVKEIHEYGSHDMFVGQKIVNVRADDGLMDEKGRLRGWIRLVWYAITTANILP